jgi:spore cortex biosynthesis protein YabQ
MNDSIFFELDLFVNAFVLGIILIFAYDLLRIFRRIVKHKKMAVALEDTIYWIISGFVVFIMLYEYNDGIIRWFAVAGVAIGMFLYNISISKFIVKYVSLGADKIIKVISRILRILFKPVYLCIKSSIKLLKKTAKKIKIKQEAKKEARKQAEQQADGEKNKNDKKQERGKSKEKKKKHK